MDSNNWRLCQTVQPPPMDDGDWRSQFHGEARQRVVNTIVETLKRQVSYSDEESLRKLTQMAMTFEEKIYSAATNQIDYLRKISLKMLSMKKDEKTTYPKALPSNLATGGGSRNPHELGSFESTAQIGGANAGDWQEEVYQKINIMKDLYSADLNEIYWKIFSKLQQLESLPQQPETERLEKLRLFKLMLEKVMLFLHTTKNDIGLRHRDKMPSFEKQIFNLLDAYKSRKPVPSMQQRPIVLPQLHSMQQPHSQLPQAQSHGANSQLQSVNSSQKTQLQLEIC